MTSPTFDIQNGLFKTNLNATVLLVEKSRLQKNKDGGYDIVPGPLLSESMLLCPTDPQSLGMPLGVCTGIIIYFFWVVLPTSCLNADNKDQFVLVKNYRDGKQTFLDTDVLSLDKVTIKETIDNTVTILELPTYSLDSYIVLDQLGTSNVGTDVYMVGYPYGLYQAFTFGRIIKEISPDKFQIKATAFGLAPGSPVFDMKTHLLAGILSSGIKKYQFNSQNQCFETFEQTNTQDVIGLPVFLMNILAYMEEDWMINGIPILVNNQTVKQITRVQEAARILSQQKISCIK